MSERERIARLESLLDRVRRNSSRPRGQPSVAPAPRNPPAVAVAPPTAPPQPIASTPIPPVISVPPVRELALEPPARAWAPEPVSAVKERPPSSAPVSSVPPEEISEDDLLEVTTIPPSEVAASVDDSELIDVSVEGESERADEAPLSSSRSKVAETLDEALASAAELEEEREVPVKTPPPESGPQQAAPPQSALEAPRLPDVAELEADLIGPPSMGPTAEQLGETIELEAPRGPELEIDVTITEPETEPERPAEELEVALPRAQMPSGMYDVPVVPTAPSPASPPAPGAGSSPDHPQADRSAGRPELGAAEVARVVLGTPAAPRSFVEILDTSLGL